MTTPTIPQPDLERMHDFRAEANKEEPMDDDTFNQVATKVKARLTAQLREEMEDPLPATRWGDGIAMMACIVVLWAHSDISWWWFAACCIAGTFVNLWQIRWLRRAM